VTDFIHGNMTSEGMLQMREAVRKFSDSVLVIAGAQDYAYDAESLIELDKLLSDDKAIMYNFHPYMGQYQAGDKKKNADGFEAIIK